MRDYIIIIFMVLLISCQNEQESMSGKLSGKIKTLQLVQLYGDMGFPFPVTYSFYYDSSNGKPNQIIIDSAGKILIDYIDDTIRLNIQDNSGSFNYICKTKINNKKKIESIYFRDSPVSEDVMIYYFSYNGTEIDSMGVPITYVAPYCDFLFKEHNLVFDGLNYTQINYVHTLALAPGSCLYPQGNTIFNYSNIPNTMQLPFQFIFTLSSPGGMEFGHSTLSVDPLYIYGLMGYTACKPNYNLLDQVGDRKYIYMFDENNRVSDMTITDTVTDIVLYQYKLTYY